MFTRVFHLSSGARNHAHRLATVEYSRRDRVWEPFPRARCFGKQRSRRERRCLCREHADPAAPAQCEFYTGRFIQPELRGGTTDTCWCGYWEQENIGNKQANSAEWHLAATPFHQHLRPIYEISCFFSEKIFRSDTRICVLVMSLF